MDLRISFESFFSKFPFSNCQITIANRFEVICEGGFWVYIGDDICMQKEMTSLWVRRCQAQFIGNESPESDHISKWEMRFASEKGRKRAVRINSTYLIIHCVLQDLQKELCLYQNHLPTFFARDSLAVK